MMIVELTPSFESEKSHPRRVEKLHNSKSDPFPRHFDPVLLYSI